MSGTRIVVVKYLRALNIDTDLSARIIDILVRRPGYPAFSTISSCLIQCGVECEISKSEKPVFCDDLYISRIKADDFKVVLMIQADTERVKFLTSEGEIVIDSFEHFCLEFGYETMKLSVPDFDMLKLRVQKLYDEEQNSKLIDGSITNIKRLSKLNEPPIYRFCRFFSIYFSYVFIKLKIHPNYITFFWFLSIAAASFCFSRGSTEAYRIAAALLIMLGYTFDCSDGEVARVTNKYSKIGGYLDTIIHWVSGLLIILGVTWGIYNERRDPGILKIGLICVLGDSIFTYIYGQLNSWRNKNSTYGLFHPIFLPLVWLFPIDLNLFLAGAIFNQLQTALKIWEIASLSLATIMVCLFFLQEYVEEKKG